VIYADFSSEKCDLAINHEDFKRFEEANMVISPQEFGIHQ
jgi:hypothetical protein